MVLIVNYKLILYIAITLLVIELGLEYRAYNRGWETIVFGFKQPLASNNVNNSKAQIEYGPTPTFPFRSAVVTQKKPPKTKRVWISSSSYAQDIYVAPDKIFPNLLVNIMQQHTTDKIQVLNASKAGYTINNNANNIENNSKIWKPDIVILYQMSNDITQLVSLNHSIDNNPTNNRPSNISSLLFPEKTRQLEHLYERTTLYSNAKSLINPWVTRSKLLVDSVNKEVVEEFEKTLDHYINVSRAQGLKVVLCTFALSHDKNSIQNPPPNVVNSVLKFNKKLSYKGWQNYVDEFNNIIRKKAGQRDLLIIDVAKDLTGKSALFRDFFHFTEDGHKYVAELIGQNKQLQEQL